MSLFIIYSRNTWSFNVMFGSFLSPNKLKKFIRILSLLDFAKYLPTLIVVVVIFLFWLVNVAGYIDLNVASGLHN